MNRPMPRYGGRKGGGILRAAPSSVSADGSVPSMRGAEPGPSRSGRGGGALGVGWGGSAFASGIAGPSPAGDGGSAIAGGSALDDVVGVLAVLDAPDDADELDVVGVADAPGFAPAPDPGAPGFAELAGFVPDVVLG